ncbi:hypothetical protein [Capnocytophaga catalasegens]|uniref:HTH cro/C1-type domain-containing protein n=1 Tax=Capnocytophaga catalasegens TaxID=1004260 RepID=A0AAV5AQJ9_9FLAO|nr:hypothetical protein [Capnocytophaga catalasegens]GIZ14228.1 hypothetical protein RCZ03_02290 [Capnocytophaga catalasegens]GJM49571.1 hypothetical protein RCZ15_05460 [Capnocytophaga catalasegens]GJM52946.1 hypothetical protein RCZ16_12630 [Capnocytophaga catalasegens]
MKEAEKIITLGKKLPYGAKKEIAKRLGFSEQTIVNFFKTGKARPKNALKIIEITKVIYDESQEIINKQNEILNSLNNRKTNSTPLE